MIYTVTFNPALDYIINVDDFVTGAVNRSEGETLFAGGKGINVSTILKNLGVDSVAMGFISSFTGDTIKRMAEDEGIKTDFIKLDNGFSRINVKIKAFTETEINGLGPKIDNAALDKLYEKLDTLRDGDTLVLAGSVPKPLPDTTYADIMERLADRDLKIVVDSTGSHLTNSLKYHPFLIKPNNHELCEIMRTSLLLTSDFVDAANHLRETGARNVLVSLGGMGAVLVTENGVAYRCDAPKGVVINTTGSGDSMVAGFLAGYAETGDYKDALRMGIAAGSASAFSLALAEGDEIRKLYKNVRVEELK